MPWLHGPLQQPALWTQYDQLSVSDQIEQLRIGGKHDEQSPRAFEVMTNRNSLSQSDRQGFVDLFILHVYGNQSLSGMINAMGSYTIGNGGMCAFASKFLDDCAGAMTLISIVSEVVHKGQQMEVYLEDGSVYAAQDVVSAIPL